ncbi:MAG: PAS domain S-box protein [Candidatus Marinimicrobia bacterium]|nr:PAS domain S-box protein [Candidatus Neomarinimicrobiota bacterium]
MLILIIEDDLGLIELSLQILKDSNYEVIYADNLSDGLYQLETQKPDILLLDYKLREFTGLDFIQKAREKNIVLPPFIVTTGFGDEKIAVSMMKQGAADYVVKDVNYLDMLPQIVNKTAKFVQQQEEHRQLKREKLWIEKLHQMILDSMDEAVHLVDTNLRIQFINRQCAQWIVKYGSSTDVIGKTLTEAFPFLPDAMIGEYDEILKTGQIKISEDVHTINGNEYFTETRKVPVFDDDQITGIITVMKNNTSTKVAEKKRFKNERMLKKVAENYPNSYMSIVYPDFTIGFTSGREFKKLGLNPDDYIGLSIDQVFLDNAPIIKKYYEKTFQGEECSFELLIYNQYQKYNTVPLYSEDGKIDSILSVVENITDNKLAQLELEKSKTLLDTTQKLSKTGGWEYDVIREEMTWTDETYRINGYDPEKLELSQSKELIEKSLICYSETDRPKLFNAFKKCIDMGVGYDFELPFQKATGENIWVRTTARAEQAEGKTVRIIGNIQDISDIKSIQEKLEKSESEFRIVAQNTPGIVFQYLVDGNHKMFTFISDDVSNLFGVSSEEVLADASKLVSKLHSEDIQMNLEIIENSIRHLKPLSMEIRINAFAGECKWLSLQATPKRMKTGGILLTGIATDISTLKETESELLYRNNLDQTLVEIANHLLKDSNYSYNDVLRLLGESFSASRTYIFQMDDQYFSNTYEWCAKGVEPQFENLQNLSVDICPWWMKKMYLREKIILSNIDLLPSEAIFERESLESQNIKALLVAPVFHGEKPVGFIGIDDTENYRHWREAEIEFLQVVVDLMENNLVRSDAEQTIRKSEELLSTLFKSMPDIVIRADLSGVIIYANDALEKLTGLKPENFIGRPVFEFIHPEDREKAYRLSKEMFDHYLGAENYQFVIPSGKKFYAEINGDVLRDEKGVPFELVYICRDITERKYEEDIQKTQLALIEYSNNHDVRELLVKFLDEAEKITESQIGFYHFVDDDQKNLSLQAWSTNTWEKYCRVPDFPSHYAIENAGVWVDCIKEKKPVIHNDFEKLPHKKGMPAGHATVTREVVVPVFRHKKAVAILGVGNKPDNYDERDVTAVAKLADLAWEIVERKLYEKKVQDSEHRLRTIIDAIPSMIYIKNAEGRYLSANQAVADFLGYNPEQVIGQLQTDIDANKEQALKMIESDREVIKSGITLESIQQITPQNSDPRWIHTIKLPYKGEDFGEPVSLGISMDITQLKKAEESLKMREEQFRTLVENIPGITYRCLNDDQYTMLFLSEEVEKITGYKYTDFINNQVRTFFSIIHHEDLEHVNIRIKKGIQSKTQYTIEYRINCKDGEIKWVYEKGRGIFNKNDVLLYLDGVIVDITDRKKAEMERAKLENRLLRSQKLETIGTLAGGIAHDFNNILTPIMGYSDMILLNTPENSPIREYVDHILKASLRAKEIVQQILIFSRKQETQKSPLKLHQVIEEAIKLMRATLPATIEIRLNLDTNCGFIMGDYTQIHQVIVNLCTNSFQAMEETGGVLTVNLQPATNEMISGPDALSLPSRDYVCLTVTDTGSGMDSAILGRIFEPFFTTKSVDKGTGMGLSVVHGIIDQHNGEIHVESEPGKGTTFQIFLPIVPAGLEKSDENGPAIEGGHEKIALCDDDESIVKMTGKMLEMMGYDIRLFNNSREALESILANRDHFQLLISDLTMPGLTGLDLAKALRESNIYIPIIIMTGYGDSLSRAVREKYKISQVISKPLAMNEFSRVVRSVLDEK